MVHKEHWKDEPDEHDYPAARNYLGLVTTDENAQAFATALALVPIVRRYAKDLLRAASSGSVGQELSRGQGFTEGGQGERLSPVLLVAGDFSTDTPLTIADGYHRNYHQLPARRGKLPHSVQLSSMWEKSPMSPQAEGRHQEARRRLQGAGRGMNAPDRPAPYVPAPSGLDVLSSGSRPYPGHIGHMP